MANHISNLLQGKDLNIVAQETKITRRKLDGFISGNKLLAPVEAVAIANYLKIDPKEILYKQTDEQLALVNKSDKKPSPRKSTHSPAFATRTAPPRGSGLID